MHTRLLILGLAALLVACGDDAPPAPTPQGALALQLDGKTVSTLPAADLVQPVLLAAALPEAARDPASWKLVEAFGLSRHLRVPDPATTYRGQDWKLYLDAEGRPSIGVFRRDRPELRAEVRRLIREPSISLVATSSVRVWTVPPPTKKPAAWDLLVVVDGKELRLASDALAALPTAGTGEPTEAGTGGGRGTGRKGKQGRAGWHLAVVIALAVKDRPIAKVVVHGGADVKLEITAEQLAARDGRIPTLKRNRRGEMLFRIVDTATGNPVGGGVRGVTRIDVTTK